ncbi:MAG: hypothetical protein HY984_01540 [Candidatus Magasanikbacteria bacterium]|nr:hypothetical protein [Candidatus Magasanikbacteria bacterium]
MTEQAPSARTRESIVPAESKKWRGLNQKRRKELSKFIGTPAESVARIFGVLLSVVINEGCRTIPHGEKIDGPIPLEKVYSKDIYGKPEVLEWPGMMGKGDYFPSGTNPLITPTSEKIKYREVTGGFAEDLKLETKFAAFVDLVSDNEVEALLKKHENKLSAVGKLTSMLKKTLRDRYVFDAFSVFLEQYDGKVVAWPTGGKYDNEGQKILNIGESDDGHGGSDKIFVHELLHFIFDKYDADMMEHPNGDGGHEAIFKLVDRFLLLRQLRAGAPPMDDEMTVFQIHNKDLTIRKAIDGIMSGALSPAEFRATIESKDVYAETTGRCMLGVLYANEHSRNDRFAVFELSNDMVIRIFEKKDQGESKEMSTLESGGKTYYDFTVQNVGDLQLADIEGAIRGQMHTFEDVIPAQDRPGVESKFQTMQTDPNFGRSKFFSPDEVQDMTFIIATNTVLLVESFRLASVVAERTGKPIAQAFGEKDYQKTFSNFLKTFSAEMDEDPTLPVRAIGRDVMDEAIANM